jgi:hypothetical protein
MGGKLLVDANAKGVVPLLPLDWLKAAGASSGEQKPAAAGGGGR